MKNVILVGMMSSGKTTLGKKLARLLDYKFVDLDKLIERDQQMDIPQIFSTKGEAYFRQIERKVLSEIASKEKMVVASGGGTPCFFDNMEVINRMGTSIFLNVPAADLARRIENHAKDDRPILSGATSVKETLEQKIKERLPFYSQAHFTLSGDIDTNQLLQVLEPVLSKN